ncbi:MAG: hypothetical protein CBC13_04870 [Planctomycetia bacterium TMED53]|nr:MAG: hypothetical protein CBC13_04870 [Planctomycetia bacterium TMED53]
MPSIWFKKIASEFRFQGFCFRQPFRSKTAHISLAAIFVALLLQGCGGGGTPGSPAPVIDFSKYRIGTAPDPLEVAPIFSDRFTDDPTANPTDFDYREVDSPSMIDDPGRNSETAPNSGICNSLLCDRYMLFYEATDNLGVNSIGLITSSEYDFDIILQDRTRLLQASDLPDLDFGGNIESALNATDPTVVLDKSNPYGTAGRYRMWLEGTYGAGGTLSAILTCESADGLTWSAPQLCTGLDLGPEFGNVSRIVDPDVVLVEDPAEQYRMIFEVIRNDGSAVLGMASSLDGIDWTVTDGVFTEDSAGPVFSGGPGAFDDGAIRSPSLGIERDEITDEILEWHLFYEGQPINFQIDNDSFIGYSNSTDGFSWSGYAIPVISPTSDLTQVEAFDSDDVKHPDIFMRVPDTFDPANNPEPDFSKFVLYYSGDPEFSGSGSVSAEVNRIGLATAE